MTKPEEAEVVRRIYRMLVKEHLRGRHITTRLHDSHRPTPSGLNHVWHPATVRRLLTNRTYAGRARDNSRQPVVPRYRMLDEASLHSLNTGRRYRAEPEWVWSDAPAVITPEVFEKAQVPLQRNAVLVKQM